MFCFVLTDFQIRMGGDATLIEVVALLVGTNLIWLIIIGLLLHYYTRRRVCVHNIQLDHRKMSDGQIIEERNNSLNPETAENKIILSVPETH